MIGRVRMINPAFFMDEDLARLDPHARLLFIGLWTIADKHGRLEDIPGRIKASLFPYEADLGVPKLLDDLCAPKQSVTGALLERYEVDGRKFIQIVNFSKYQKPHPREAESGFPPPRQTLGEPRQTLGAPRQPVSNTESKLDSVSDTEYGAALHAEIDDIREQRESEERRLTRLLVAIRDSGGDPQAAVDAIPKKPGVRSLNLSRWALQGDFRDVPATRGGLMVIRLTADGLDEIQRSKSMPYLSENSRKSMEAINRVTGMIKNDSRTDPDWARALEGSLSEPEV